MFAKWNHQKIVLITLAFAAITVGADERQAEATGAKPQPLSCTDCLPKKSDENVKQTVFGPTGVKLFEIYIKPSCAEPNKLIAHPMTPKGQSLIYASEVIVVKQELDDLIKRRGSIQDNYDKYVRKYKDDGINRTNREISDLNYAILSRQHEMKALVGQVYMASERAKTQTASIAEKMELTPVLFESWPSFHNRAREFAKPLKDFNIVCDRPAKRSSILDIQPRVVINEPKVDQSQTAK